MPKAGCVFDWFVTCMELSRLAVRVNPHPPNKVQNNLNKIKMFIN